MATNNWAERTILLLSEQKFEVLQNAHVLVAGLGGVGSFAAEFLVRAGIGNITIIDHDTIHPSNINRQIHALHSTVGKSKALTMKQRLLDINPNLNITALQTFINEQNVNNILNANFSYVIDAIDTLTPKILLIYNTIQKNIPLVSSLGSGGRLDPSKIKVDDISKTHGDKLGRLLRKRLHKLGIYSGFKAVFSTEKPNKNAMLFVNEQNKKTTWGTISYLPAIFGALCAATAINDLLAASPSNNLN